MLGELAIQAPVHCPEHMNCYTGIDVFADRLHVPCPQQCHPLQIESGERREIVFPMKGLHLLVCRNPVINKELPDRCAINLSEEQGGRAGKPVQNLSELRVAAIQLLLVQCCQRIPIQVNA